MIRFIDPTPIDFRSPPHIPNLPTMDSMRENTYFIMCSNHRQAQDALNCFVSYLIDIDLDHIDCIDKFSNEVRMEDGIRYIFLDCRVEKFLASYRQQIINIDDFFAYVDMLG